MSGCYDPYYKWLGIPPEEQPPHCYRLLGIRPFESDAEVIDMAADRQMAHLRNFQTGARSELSQRLLNEVSAARICLLNPANKAAYDSQLHTAFAQQSAVQKTRPIAQPLAEQSPAGQVEPAEEIDPHLIDLFEETKRDNDSSILERSGIRKRGKNSDIHHRGPSDSGVQQAATAGDSAIRRNLAELKKRKTVMWLYAGSGAGGLLAIVLLIVVLVSGSSRHNEGDAPSDDGVLIVEMSPVDHKAGTTLLIDGKEVSLTGTGPVEHKCPPGPHGVEIRRPGYRPFMKYVELESGGQQRISPQWKPCSLLNVQLPAADRSTAALQIDGRIVNWRQDSHEYDAAKVAFALEPGTHSVAISLAGYETDAQTIELAEGRSKTIKPDGLPQTTGEPIDLLALIDLEAHAITSGWQRDGKVLISPSVHEGRLQIPIVPPEEYVVTTTVERVSGSNGFAIGLVADAKQFMTFIDGWEPVRSALEMVDGRRGIANGTDHLGRLLISGHPKTFLCYVTTSGVRVLCEGEQIIDWRGEFDRLAMPQEWEPSVSNALFIGANDVFRVSKLELAPIRGTVKHLTLPASQPIAEIEHRANGRRFRHTFYENGGLNAPLSLDRWSITDDKLFLRWHVGDVDTCALSADGRSYQGRNQQGVAIAGECLDGSLLGEVTPEQPQVIAQRRPVPKDPELTEALKRIENAYQAETADENRKLAAQLRDKATGISAESPERYGFYWRAIGLAEDGGDARLALEVIDTIAGEYEVDAFNEKVTCLRKLADRAKDEATLSSLVDYTTAITEEAIALENYDLAKELVDRSYASFPRRSDSQALRITIYKHRQAIHKLHGQWQDFLAAKIRLETAPNVPSDNLIVGRWLCLHGGDWDAGLPYLIRSDVPTLRDVARRDVSMPAENYAAQLLLGDAYGRLASEEKDPRAKVFWLLRAGHWYDKSLPHTSSVAEQDRLRSRLAEIEKVRQKRRVRNE